MRRFIAYILTSITIFLGIGVAFKPVATSINPDISYTNGRAISYRIKRNDSSEIKDNTDVKAYSEIIKQRLDAYSVSDYKIVTEGLDTITVTVTAKNQNANKYNYIAKILAVNPVIEIAPIDEKEQLSIVDEANYKWHDNKAYITYDGNTSILVMPIPSAAKSKVEELIKYCKEELEKKKSNDEEKTPDSIVLWFNRQENEKYSMKDKNENIKNKIIKVFNSTNFFYGSDQSNFQMKFTPATASKKDIQNAYDEAVYYQNMLNASVTNYTVSEINNVPVEPTVESLLIFGDKVQIRMSASFIALIIAFIAISIILSLVYRLGAVSIVTTASAFTFLSFLLFTLFNSTFNISAYVGIILLFLISVFVGVMYNNYLHEECYKGRSLKKANFEASKRTTLLTLDLSIVLLVSGLLVYFIGGATISSLGVLFIIGAVINVFINTFLLKGMMWLVTNSSRYQNRLSVFHIDSKKVPNLAKEEKPTYISPFAGKELTKHGKIASIVTGGLILASAIGMIVFGSISGELVNTKKYLSPTYQLSYRITRDYGSADPIPSLTDFKEKVLNQIKNGNNTLKYDTDINSFETNYWDDSLKKDDPIHKTDYTYVITVTESDPNSLTYSSYGSNETSLVEAFSNALNNGSYYEPQAVSSLDKVELYNLPSHSVYVFAASIASLAICSVYFAFRYRPSRALTLFVLGASALIITMGIMTLTRISATPAMAISTMITMLLVILIGLIIMHKDKELIRDERIRDIETRKKVLNKAFTLSLIPMYSFATISFISLIVYSIFTNKVFLALFISSSFGTLIGALMFSSLFTHLANFFEDKFMRIKLPEIKRKKKKKVIEKSNEPSEAIFIGIND